MNKFVKNALIFISGVAGGFVLCGVTIGKILIKSNTFRETVINKISDKVTSFLYGETKRSKIGYKPYKVSYRDYYTGRKIETPCYDEIILETLDEAEKVLSFISDIFEDYGVVYVADVYDLCGVPSNFKDNKIGWNDSHSVSKMHILKTKYGYKLKLPKPVDIIDPYVHWYKKEETI